MFGALGVIFKAMCLMGYIDKYLTVIVMTTFPPLLKLSIVIEMYIIQAPLESSSVDFVCVDQPQSRQGNQTQICVVYLMFHKTKLPPIPYRSDLCGEYVLRGKILKTLLRRSIVRLRSV